MPLHVAIWSQIVMDSDLSWADQGKSIRVLANAWSTGELIRAKWCGDEAWRAAERMWPEMLAERNKNLRTKDANSARAKAAAEARWAAENDARSMLGACVEHPPSIAQSKEQEQEQEQEPKNRERAPKRRPARRCPEDFTLTTERFEYAVGKGLTVAQVGTAFEKFKNHEFKTPRSDWDATWRNWAIGEAEKYATRPSPQPDRPAWKNSGAPVESRQNVPSYEETQARLRAEDEERQRIMLRDQARQLRAM